MRILLDTHIALWAITDDAKLPRKVRDLLLVETNDIFVSVASVWEIAIKHSLARENMPVDGKRAYEWFRESGYAILPIEAEHAIGVEMLPEYHHDPFDRLLVSQALWEPLRLITHDKTVAKYSDTIVFV